MGRNESANRSNPVKRHYRVHGHTSPLPLNQQAKVHLSAFDFEQNHERNFPHCSVLRNPVVGAPGWFVFQHLARSLPFSDRFGHLPFVILRDSTKACHSCQSS